MDDNNRLLGQVRKDFYQVFYRLLTVPAIVPCYYLC